MTPLMLQQSSWRVAWPMSLRRQSPGRIYILANVITLFCALGVQLSGAASGADAMTAVAAYLFGSPGATWLTVATLLFIASGEMRHRAWTGHAESAHKLERRSDFVSGLAAICLTIALACFCDPALALASGIMLAGARFGSAIAPDGFARRGRLYPAAAIFGPLVIASRFPALAALTLELFRIHERAGPFAEAFLPCVILFCFMLRLWADVLLLGRSRAQMPRTRHSHA